ncbi:tRNA (N(6)-L-threonylcarbamoyladenosine(37)-C(2))-methylthiotransferase MtaB [Adlercreutzia sp. R25]|uniref:tRNA (N(6)-L-threonylcarbamoyladenosine(37)-C(2))- methylthiotransferase MtaB n=1 Tax=Adlercreutzia shanghongiae TaxID=3111773 RepID=UPI002DB8568E|nr:tRNA (N(6)-L-threonylcarbamoyladenosine(37)-C(2))-methylthiotransferase MtaB [Adlercreutzia sp. R25]MEC4272395.1 tRNA (N(6)-L-threonylcarbamoyladenosine(37)-C(2))-methylthiotransferase MtaB [Adlercreutzia sp. R25]
MNKAPFGYAVVNLGCKVNRVEADLFERLLAERGGIPVPESAADLIIVNTCTVTGEAEKKTRKAVRHALSAAETAEVVVTGCATQIDASTYEAMGDRVTVVPKAGMALYLEEGAFLPQLPERSAEGAESKDPAPLLPTDGRTRIGIKVQDGCDNACTYCIVHVARGRAVSRPADEVVAEAMALAEEGVREVVLTGINLGSYDDDGTDLVELCRRLLAATADIHGPNEPPCRFRIGSIEPNDVSDEFVFLLAEAEGRLCRHLHLPLQSGSSKILREMARPYDAEDYRHLVDFLRAQVPSIALTTDIIVGFPGETDENFEDTCELARRCGFSKIHVFPYSKREGTPAAEREDQVEAEVKAARAARLRALSDELAQADRASRAGTVELALVESTERATTESYLEVAAPAGTTIGALCSVEL